MYYAISFDLEKSFFLSYTIVHFKKLHNTFIVYFFEVTKIAYFLI